MSTKKLTVLLVSIVILALTVASIFIMSIFLFIRDIQQSATRLENGSYVSIGRSGMRNIYIEDSTPPLFFEHQFTFVNIETQVAVHSFTPDVGSTYSIGVVTINNEIQQGRFGTRIAMVYLERGTYTIEFLPYEGTGEFVWGGALEAIFRFAIRLIILTIMLITLTVTFIIAAVKRKQLLTPVEVIT